MKRSPTSLKTTFSRLRFLAVSALVCTLIATLFMLVESWLPGKLSAKQSAAISDTIKDVADVNDNDVDLGTRSIFVSGKLSGYTGRRSQLSVMLLPGGDVSDLEYAFDDDSVAHLDGTALVFDRCGKTNLTFCVAADKNVSRSVQVECFGLHPSQVTDITPAAPLGVRQGEYADLALLDQNGDPISCKGFSTTVADESVATLNDGKVLGLLTGHTSISLSYGDLQEDFSLDVSENPDFVCPTSFEFESERTFTAGTYFSLADLLRPVPHSAAFGIDSALISVDCNETINPLNEQLGLGKFFAETKGEATLTVTSAYNPDCSATIRIIVTEPTPMQLTIIGKNRIVSGYKYRYLAYGDNTIISDVKWEVVSGKARIQDGALIPTGLGSVVLKATSVANPSLSAELKITVSLFSSFHMFVRKIIGHFSLFAVIGLGISACCFLLMKRRKFWLPTSIASGFCAACASEMLQLPAFTSGRAASWVDVAIDFCGSLCGVALVLAALGVAALILRRSKRKRHVKEALTALNIRTAFSPSSRLPLLLDDEYSL